MPSFLEPTNPALNDTLAPKRKVNRNNIRQFADEKHSNLGTTEEIEGKYDSVVNTLTGLYTSLAELANLLIYSDARSGIVTRSRRNVNEYFSNIFTNINRLDLLLNKYKTFNLFNPEQVSNIQILVSSIVEKYGLIKSAPQLAGQGTIQSNLFRNELQQISQLDVVLQKVQGALGSYRQVPSGSSQDYAITAIPIPAPTLYRPPVKVGGAVFSPVGRNQVFSDGYSINDTSYSQPARFY
jgi:hypothetical protein